MTRETPGPYQLFMLALCIVALLILVTRALAGMESEARRFLEYADNALCVVFFGDFLYSVATAANRWRYFTSWGWLDLLSSIPAVDALRIGRAARIFRVLRVVRGIRASKLLADLFLGRRRENVALVTVLVTVVTLIAAGTAVLEFEHAADGGNIKTAGDALWWSVTTLTTVGYGDRFPVTTGGRTVGAVLMVLGIGLFGAMSGLVASWLLAGDRDSTGDQG